MRVIASIPSMEFPEESLVRAEEGNSELNHQVNLPIVYASNKGRGELPTRHLPSRSTSVCSFIAILSLSSVGLWSFWNKKVFRE